MTAQWVETRDVPLTRLTKFPGNARRGDVMAIQESIKKLGQYRALVVREVGSDLIVLAGNHTKDALEAEGHATARCEVIRCDDQDAVKINIADNRLSDISTYDNEDLAELLASLHGDFDGTGYDLIDYEAIKTLLEPPDLDQLAKDLGEPEEGDTWPSLKLRIPHHLLAAWNDHLKMFHSEAEAFASLLGLHVDA